MSERGFSHDEYQNRLINAQTLMEKQGLDALFVTTHPDIYYFTGFLTRFWESPTRPWFVVIPRSGKPIAVIPGIGASLMRSTWVEDVRTWTAPDLQDDGVTLLAETLIEVAGSGKVGLPSAMESMLRMPLDDYHRLRTFDDMPELVSDGSLVRNLRMIKSEAEIRKIKQACDIAGRAFDRVGEFAHAGMPLDSVFRRFQITCLEEGADWVPYLAGGAGPDGYGDVISPASNTPLNDGDVFMLDTGLIHDGYFCDYDRNFVVENANTRVSDAHKRLIDATMAGFEAAKPGAKASDLYHAMDKVLTGGIARNDNGRLGHGLGINLTEWPSLIASDKTELVPGMVLTLEPGIETVDGMILVHEENIVITERKAQWLSRPVGHEIMKV